ncbi:MAG TPA: YetF domain-containing protein [Thermomicrobiales bacterium]|nr:YetF domain-containing protein [Thermomicrobiales bacterium]
MNEVGVVGLTAIAARTAIVLLVLIVGVRVSGKRHIGELNVYDLMLVLVAGNAVQNAMTKAHSEVTVALVSAGTLMLLGWLFAKADAYWPGLERRAVGTPTVVAQHGELNRRNLRREGVTEEEVLAAAREQGVADLAGVELAVLELDGEISVVPAGRGREG